MNCSDANARCCTMPQFVAAHVAAQKARGTSGRSAAMSSAAMVLYTPVKEPVVAAGAGFALKVPTTAAMGERHPEAPAAAGAGAPGVASSVEIPTARDVVDFASGLWY